MGILSRLRRKESETARAVSRLVTLGQPIWTPRNYAQLADEGYRRNVWVYACVTEISRAVKGVPWQLFRVGRGEELEVDDHALLDVWQRPNLGQSGGAFREALTGFWLLAGNAYVEAVLVGRDVRELHLLRPDRMKVIPGERGVAGYEYKAGSTETRFEPEQILHLRLFNPLNDWYGMSPIEAAAYSIDQHNASGSWNKSLLDHFARPPGLLRTEEWLDPNQMDRLERVFEERWAGKDNAGRPIVLEGGLDWQAVGMTPAEMDWLEGRHENAAEILATYGVPPELVGLKPGTYENRREARKALYTEVILPLLDHLADELNAWLTPRFGDGLELRYDREAIEALQDDRAAVWQRAKDSDFLSVDEKRALVGYDALPDGAGDVVLVPATLLPLGAMSRPEPEPDGDGQAGAKSLPLFGAGSDGAILWKAVDQLRLAWERRWQAEISRLLDDDARAAVTEMRAEPSDWAEQVVRALKGRRDVWHTALEALMRATAEDFGERTIAGSGLRQDPAQAFAAALDQWVATWTARKVVGITDTTREALTGIVREAVEQGNDLRQAREAIRSAAAVSTPRADVIARTEVLSASSFGRQAGARALGMPLRKTWIASLDNRTRPDHREAGGQTVPMDEPYTVGGHHGLFPGDPAFPPDQTIQCRCAETYETA